MKLFKLENDYENGRTTLNLFGLKLKFINKKLIKRPDYAPILERIRNKYSNNEKIRVGFLVNENCKWNAEKLYNLLEENEYFEPVILISLYNTRHQKKDMTKSSVEDNYNFFAKTGKRIQKVYDEEKEQYLDLKDFDVDILFYQQPWGIDKTQTIENASKHSICCYYAYGIGILESAVDVRPFHEKLFYYFIPNKETEVRLKKFEINNLDNLNIIGFPKLDVYNDLEEIPHEKKTIIYAPHHSYNRGLRIGTFDKTGKDILEYAKQHQEYNWIFKPHPDLREVLYKDKKFGAKIAEDYYKQWAEVGTIYDKGNYFELFMASDILITDCNAFLLEFMPTLKPIIRLERKGSVKVSDLGKHFLEGMYRARNIKELEETIFHLENVPGDNLLPIRKSLVRDVLRNIPNASGNIVEELEKLFLE